MECNQPQQKPFSLWGYFQRQRSRITWPSRGLLEDFGQGAFPEKNPTRFGNERKELIFQLATRLYPKA